MILKTYDGLPLNGGGSRIFPGNPLTNSFNTQYSLGVVISFDVWKGLTDALKNDKRTNARQETPINNQ